MAPVLLAQQDLVALGAHEDVLRGDDRALDAQQPEFPEPMAPVGRNVVTREPNISLFLNTRAGNANRGMADYLDPSAPTTAKKLKAAGYATAHWGKWHMGGDPGDEGYVAHDGDTNNNPGNTVGKVSRQPTDLTDPNTVDAYELGLKSTILDGRMRLNVAAFYNDYKGLTTSSFIADALQ